MSDWIRVTAALPSVPEDWSLLAEAFAAAGCASTEILDRPPSLVGYLSQVPGAAAVVASLRSELEALGAVVTEEPFADQAWSELWKVHFKPRKIGRVWLRPTWESPVEEPETIEIVLDPGQAFGTGDHPTTRVCLELLQRVSLANRTVLDLGCGSGVLAIAAAKLGAQRVDASDIEPLSVEITRENAARNEVTLLTSVQDGVPPGDWEVVVSNIISATLIRLAPEAFRAVRSGGDWIMSGIIEGNWPDVRKAAEREGFGLVETVQESEWVGAWFRR